MIPGIAVLMGGREWSVPPLTLGQLRHLMPKIRQLSEIGPQMAEPQIDVLVEIVAAALQRNYPDISIQMVENLLDLGNAALVLHAVLTGSGLRPGSPSSGNSWPPGPPWGPPPRSRRRLGMHLRTSRHRMRIQLSYNRCDDALSGRRADTLLDRSSTAASGDRLLSRDWETTKRAFPSAEAKSLSRSNTWRQCRAFSS